MYESRPTQDDIGLCSLPIEARKMCTLRTNHLQKCKQGAKYGLFKDRAGRTPGCLQTLLNSIFTEGS